MSDFLETRARRAYELGRLRWSLRVAPFILAAAAAAVAGGRPIEGRGFLCAALLSIAAGLGFAGGSGGPAWVSGRLARRAAVLLALSLRTLWPIWIRPRSLSYC